jgi:hypothetical protein
VEEVTLVQVEQLSVPRQEEEELGLKRGARLVLIELSQEGIVDLLENPLGVELPSQELYEGRLADTDGSVPRPRST